MKKRKSLFIVLIVVFLFSSLIYGIYNLSESVYTQQLEASLESLQIRYPDSMSKMYEKFGDDLEIIDVERGSINITCKYSTEFENKYNASGKAKEDFLQDIADEWFECFHDELAAEMKKEFKYRSFHWPVSISFELEKGDKYKMIAFFYDDFDKCEMICIEKK